jgi:hypothetical protein
MIGRSGISPRITRFASEMLRISQKTHTMAHGTTANNTKPLREWPMEVSLIIASTQIPLPTVETSQNITIVTKLKAKDCFA